MRHFRLGIAALAAGTTMLAVGGPTATSATPQRASAPAASRCSSGYVEAHFSWGDKCLRAGEFCKVGNSEYHAYGFDCPASGHLTYYSSPTPATTTLPMPASATTTVPSSVPATSSGLSVTIGHTVLLRRRARTSGCNLGPLPDRRCSPGAYYSGLTKAVICSASFRTGPIRNVPESEKHQIEVEYGLPPRGYGSTLEIDHIVSLELGGSNDIANLYPEKAVLLGHAPGFHVKDKLENAVHDWVCEGKISLRAAQMKIATNWEALYKLVFGVAPVG